MHTYLDNFHQGGKYSAQIASHPVELRREENSTDQKSLNISSLQTDYLNLDSNSDFVRNIKRANTVQTNCPFCGGNNHSTVKFLKRIRKNRKELMRMVLQTTEDQNGHLENGLDVDLKITYL